MEVLCDHGRVTGQRERLKNAENNNSWWRSLTFSLGEDARHTFRSQPLLLSEPHLSVLVLVRRMRVSSMLSTQMESREVECSTQGPLNLLLRKRVSNSASNCSTPHVDGASRSRECVIRAFRVRVVGIRFQRH